MTREFKPTRNRIDVFKRSLRDYVLPPRGYKLTWLIRYADAKLFRRRRGSPGKLPRHTCIKFNRGKNRFSPRHLEERTGSLITTCTGGLCFRISRGSLLQNPLLRDIRVRIYTGWAGIRSTNEQRMILRQKIRKTFGMTFFNLGLDLKFVHRL